MSDSEALPVLENKAMHQLSPFTWNNITLPAIFKPSTSLQLKRSSDPKQEMLSTISEVSTKQQKHRRLSVISKEKSPEKKDGFSTQTVREMTRSQPK
jgi:hypothetical protein